MSCARPLFQVNLRGVFDHAKDLNDHLVIERRSGVLNRDGLENDHPGGLVGKGGGHEDGGGGGGGGGEG